MQSGDFYARVISTNYPQAAGSHGPHRPSACITTYPHPRQPFSPVLRVADGPNLRDPTAGCNLHPAWNEAMCTIGPDSEAKEKRREPRVEKALLPSFPSSYREQGYRVASCRGHRREEKRETRERKKKRNRLLMPGAYREPVKSGP